MRPAELAADDVLDLPVFQHCLHWLRENEGHSPDMVVHLRRDCAAPNSYPH